MPDHTVLIDGEVFLVVTPSACPGCGEKDHDKLLWDEDGVVVTCQTCGNEYDPETPADCLPQS